MLSLTALGVVYGDIGTSPLYAIQRVLRRRSYGARRRRPANVYGVLSLIVWSLILVVSVKYIVFIMRADNRGEGGILALLALLLQQERRTDDTTPAPACSSRSASSAPRCSTATAIITPAISVLGAVEGIEVATPALRALRRADHVRDPLRAVHGAAVRHGAGRQRVRTDRCSLWFLTIARARRPLEIATRAARSSRR